MDKEAYILAANEADKLFAQAHPNFHRWWSSHPHRGGPELKFAVPSRVAFKVDQYRKEFEDLK